MPNNDANTHDKNMPLARVWKPQQVAARLNRSIPWLYEHLPRLRQLGFPPKDKELGGWDAKAVDAWLDRRLETTPRHNLENEMLEAARGKN